jgi:hypothetical protein
MMQSPDRLYVCEICSKKFVLEDEIKEHESLSGHKDVFDIVM